MSGGIRRTGDSSDRITSGTPARPRRAGDSSSDSWFRPLLATRDRAIIRFSPDVFIGGRSDGRSPKSVNECACQTLGVSWVRHGIGATRGECAFRGARRAGGTAPNDRRRDVGGGKETVRSGGAQGDGESRTPAKVGVADFTRARWTRLSGRDHREISRPWPMCSRMTPSQSGVTTSPRGYLWRRSRVDGGRRRAGRIGMTVAPSRVRFRVGGAVRRGFGLSDGVYAAGISRSRWRFGWRAVWPVSGAEIWMVSKWKLSAGNASWLSGEAWRN